MMADHVHSRALMQHDRLLPDRRLRNRIILGNAIVWVTIVILISLISIGWASPAGAQSSARAGVFGRYQQLTWTCLLYTSPSPRDS